MGVQRLMGTILRHPATKDALMEDVPLIDCLLIDYNANIHYILQKTITELNEILYLLYMREIGNKTPIHNSLFVVQNNNLESGTNLEIGEEELSELIDRYNEDHNLGTTYKEVSTVLSSEEKICDIIFKETINYTRKLICSLNKGSIKKVVIALDGTPSMAKIKEQKNRRYIGSLINNIKEDIVKKYKFRDANILQINLFYYRSMICAGTKFMEKVQQALFHLDIGLDTDVSTLNIKGEGEKKLIHIMMEMKEYENYCIMSPDSDMLILIALLCNDPKFIGKKLYNFRIDHQKKNRFQFFDLNLLLRNFQKYFSDKLKKEIDLNKMLDVFFMLVVFGNDFLPKLEPLDITQHFDFVCESCLTLSLKGLCFIEGGKLNYKYMLEFFKMINERIIEMAIEQSLNDKYNNYQKLCQTMSITENDIRNNLCHPLLKPVTVTYKNFHKQMRILTTAYTKFMNFVQSIDIRREDIRSFYMDMKATIFDSYLLLVLPKMLRYPGSQSTSNCYLFFVNLMQYIISTRNFRSIKFRNRLMPKDFDFHPSREQQSTLSTYMMEMEKLAKSMEPYRSIFHIETIKLVTYDLENDELIDLRPKYYETYVKQNTTKKEIENLVVDYLTGIEWLYQYYIVSKHHEWNSWAYKNTQPPLIEDIIAFLEKNPCPQELFDGILKSYPENTMGPTEHHLFVTPNDYTKAGVSPNLADVTHLIDGNGALYLNKCQIKWHEY